MGNHAKRSLLYRHYWSYLPTKLHCLNVLLEVRFIFYLNWAFYFIRVSYKPFLHICFSPISKSSRCDFAPFGCTVVSLKVRGVERCCTQKVRCHIQRLCVNNWRAWSYTWISFLVKKVVHDSLGHTPILFINWGECDQRVPIFLSTMLFVGSDL